MLRHILDKLGYISKKESDNLIRVNIYNTLVYCENESHRTRQFKYEKHMHEIIYQLADKLGVNVEHRLDSYCNLSIKIVESQNESSHNRIPLYRTIRKYGDSIYRTIFRKR